MDPVPFGRAETRINRAGRVWRRTHGATMSYKAGAAIAAILWGFTYIVATTLLPEHPAFNGAVRSCGGALILLAFARELPPRDFWLKLLVLGTLNTGLFFGLLFLAALLLPGGVAGTLQAMGPLFTVLLGWLLLQRRPSVVQILSLIVGAIGAVMIIVLGGMEVSVGGSAVALASALSLALGGTLLQRWGQPMSLAGFTGWQLVVAAIELGIVTSVVEDFPATITMTNVVGLGILSTVLTSIPFLLWFRAVGGAGASAVSPMLLLSPLTAFILDAIVYGLMPGGWQIAGAIAVTIGLLISAADGGHATRAKLS